MTSLSAPKLLLGLALVSTVAPKALPNFRLSEIRPLEAETPAEARTVAFFRHHGFEAHAEQRRFGPFVHATSGECRLSVLDVDPNGSTRDKVRLIAMNDDRILFVFNG